MTTETQQTTDVVNVQGAHAEAVNMTMAEGQQAKPADPSVPTAESLGVTPEQFAKYYSAESKSYNWQAHAREAEYKAQQRGAASAEPTTDTTTPAADGAQSAVKAAGLDFDALETKILDKGDLDPEDYQKLVAVGIPEATAKDYVAGVAERALAQLDRVYAMTGGEEGMNVLAAWAAKNLTDAEVEAIEQKMASPTEYKDAVTDLMTRAGMKPGAAYSAPATAAPVHGPNASTGGTTGAKPYASQAEMIADQRNPAYKTDPAFRAQVYARAAVSTWGMNPRAHSGGL